MAVLDILPNCVSSVYFMYDKKWEKHSLGKLSAMHEACLAKEMHDAGAPGMTALYMGKFDCNITLWHYTQSFTGFYIHSCVKMRYKGDYSPSYLVDPEEYSWHPLNSCAPLLDRYKYACFTHPEHSLVKAQDPGSDSTPNLVPDEGLLDVNIVDSVQNNAVNVVPVNRSKSWRRKSFREDVYSHINGLGVDLAKDIILWPS